MHIPLRLHQPTMCSKFGILLRIELKKGMLIEIPIRASKVDVHRRTAIAPMDIISGWSAVSRRFLGFRWAGYRKFVVGSVLVGVASTLVPASVMARDTAPSPSGGGVVVTRSGLVLPVREVLPDGYLVTTPCWNQAVVSTGAYISDVDVVLDPGHGGEDLGMIGREGLREEDLNLSIAKMAAAYLEARGYRVFLTRTTDVRLPILVRAEIARALNPDVFVSIHHNSGATRRSDEPGTETYHHANNPNSMRLAGILYEEIRDGLSQYDIDWRRAVFRGANAIVRQRDGKDLYGILQYTPGMTSVITEAAYLSNLAEERLLSDETVQTVEASAIADGIVRYLTTDDPGSGYNGTHVTSRRLYSGGTGNCVDPPLETMTEAAFHEPDHYRDVAGRHLSAVESLLGEGVFNNTECGPELLCPSDPIQRWVLAVWLVRALEGVELEPIPVTRFGDIDTGQWWAPYVERLAALGVTRGCATDPVRFCPNDSVTRGQMASLVVRAFAITGDSSVDFTDISRNSHSVNIAIAASSDLIQGCGVNPARFCPHQPITRAQTAAILASALDFASAR